jgi:thioredoxin-like negative regulator of GroEL
VIELVLEAERALAVGLLDQAERQFGAVVAADPRNAIALVGLARVSLERGDQAATYRLARRALAIDPENPAASHLARRMAEQLMIHGEAIPDDEPPAEGAAAAPPSSVGNQDGEPPLSRRFLDRLRRRR